MGPVEGFVCYSKKARRKRSCQGSGRSCTLPGDSSRLSLPPISGQVIPLTECWRQREKGLGLGADKRRQDLGSKPPGCCRNPGEDFEFPQASGQGSP